MNRMKRYQQEKKDKLWLESLIKSIGYDETFKKYESYSKFGCLVHEGRRRLKILREIKEKEND